jgi:hydroxymethylpyrimidine pyrophosphatase-like HAD family hydrolase
MPIRGGKGQSMLYLIKNIIGHHDMVMSFGDAKTDIDMFMCSTVGVV